MNNDSGFYPDIRTGDPVIFTTDPGVPEANWRLGTVRVAKTLSCDIRVDADGGAEYRHDCLHADDPRVKTTRLWAQPGRGVFRLATVEIERRQDRGLFNALQSKVSVMERQLERLLTNQQPYYSAQANLVEKESLLPHRSPGRPRKQTDDAPLVPIES
jgi:hypothetical protein